MTKIEALKKLLKFNLLILNDNINGIDKELLIEFKGDEFIVLDKDNKVIFKDLLKNYDLDYEGQKKFFINVASKVVSWIKDKDNLECSFFNNLINNCIDVLGSGDIYENNRIIKYTDDIEDIDLFLDNVIFEIKNKLDKDKIRVVICPDDFNCEINFYVDGVIYDEEIGIYYIEDVNGDLDELEDLNEIYDLYHLDYDSIIKDDWINLYYSITTKEEIEKAIKFIKELVA